MPEQPAPDEQTEIKKRAIRRVIAASVLVAAAIAALTVLTRYKPEIPATRTTAPNTEIAPALPAAPSEEMAAPPTTPPEPEAQPATPPPPPPEVVNTPTAATSSAPAMKAAKPMPVRPGSEAEVSARPAPAKPAAVPAPAALATPPAKQQPVPPAPAEKAPQPSPRVPEPTVTKGYSVQLGVFSNPANAIQLQEKLAQNGIKSYTETKLNVGPFQSKAEAEQAMAKIRALGIGAVVVPAR